MQCLPTEPPHFPKLQTAKHIYQAVGFTKLALLGKSYPYDSDIYVTEATQYIPLGTYDMDRNLVHVVVILKLNIYFVIE